MLEVSNEQLVFRVLDNVYGTRTRYLLLTLYSQGSMNTDGHA